MSSYQMKVSKFDYILQCFLVQLYLCNKWNYIHVNHKPLNRINILTMHSKFGHRAQPMFINRANLPGFLRPMGPPYDPYGLG